GTSIDHYDDFGTHPTLYAGLSRWATPTLKLRASGGRGYRPPAFHELYFVPFFGNPSLVPEQGWSAELGLDWESDTGTRLSITGYYQRFDDLIQLTLAPTLSLFVGENVPDARIWGFELEGSQSWSQGVTTGIDYSYTDSRDLDSGLVLPRRPHHQGRAYCEWQLSAVPLMLRSELVYRGSHFDDSEERFRTDDAYLNMHASYRISTPLQVYLRGENLTDDRTPEVFSFGARGAAVFGGVRLDL
ncbi:MAG: TonB-dependent receptor domain-containing protein, partial [Gammaproteobacteria bacterium]